MLLITDRPPATDVLVSIVITTFRRPSLLPRAIGSVLRQRRPMQDVELIVSDDDAGQSARAVLEGLDTTGLARTVYLHRRLERQGPAAARNRALDQARGRYVLFLDDDDQLLPDTVAALLKGIADADFCAGAYTKTRESLNGEALQSETRSVHGVGYAQLQVENAFPIGSFLLRRDRIQDRFNTRLRTLEDWLFLLDNLEGLALRTIESTVLDIRLRESDVDVHRNTARGAQQWAVDHHIVYALHPSADAAPARRKVLDRLPAVDDESLFGLEVDGRRPTAIATPQGRFLILNKHETIQQTLMQQREFEPLAWRLAVAFADATPCGVLDVGANLGAFAVPVARDLPHAAVVAFEAQQGLCRHLSLHATLNELANLDIHHRAIGRPATLGATLPVPRFDIFSERYLGSVSLDPSVQQVRRGLEGVAEPSDRATVHDAVRVMALDELQTHLPISFVKIDVEGMELEVLRSGARLLATHRPFLFFEAWTLPAFAAQRAALLEAVADYGYKTIVVGEDCFAFHPERIGAAEVDRRFATLGIRIARP